MHLQVIPTVYRLHSDPATNCQLVASFLTTMSQASVQVMIMKLGAYGAGVALPDFGKKGNVLGIFGGAVTLCS